MYLVTGGAGFIGSNIAKTLSENGHSVIIADSLGTDNIKWKNISRTLLEGVIHPSDINSYLAKNPKLDGIIHMGAISATTAVDGDEIVATNFKLSKDLWTFCALQKIPFIYASSAATYGDGSHGFEDNNDLETMKALRPLNLYGWSKQWFDLWALKQIKDGQPSPPQWAGLKFFNVYGPRELHKEDMMSIVSKNYQLCAEGKLVKLFKSHHPDYDDGGQLRDFVYVADCVSVALWFLKQSGVNGIFNVGSGQARSFRDLITAAFSAADKPPNIEYIPMPEKLRGKYQYYTQANLDSLRKAGYTEPMTTLEDGVTDLLQSYLLTEYPQG